MKTREESIKILENFVSNSGYFSVLIIGENGVGKEYILKNIIENHYNLKKESKEKKFEPYYPFEIGETAAEIEKIFEKNIILIKDIETLSTNQQNILFKALSTEDGRIGIGKNKDFKRLLFTSSYNIEKLRDSKEYLTDRFWDRVSQLVVEIPSFKDYSANIIGDFESVWEKMSFKEYPKLPEDGDFRYWLKENCGTFAGNFRDLDKIAILWHQYRIIEYEGKKQKFKSDVETRIFRKVRKDFESLVHYPTQKADISNIFEFEKSKTWEQIDRAFKSKFKKWAKETYGTIKQATKELNMPYRKMDKW